MKIICVGRNYRAHAEELNNPVPSEPLIFMKPDTSLKRPGRDFYYPEFTQDLHYECELVLRIGQEGKHIAEEFVPRYINGIGLGIDFTARDIQSRAKEKGWPWLLAKGFNDSAPVSDFFPPEQFPDYDQIQFTCHINDELRQEGRCNRMIFTVPVLVSYISRFITLKKGDLIFTGTPKGVGPVQIGDHITGHLMGEKVLDFHVK